MHERSEVQRKTMARKATGGTLRESRVRPAARRAETDVFDQIIDFLGIPVLIAVLAAVVAFLAYPEFEVLGDVSLHM